MIDLSTLLGSVVVQKFLLEKILGIFVREIFILRYIFPDKIFPKLSLVQKLSQAETYVQLQIQIQEV